MKQVIIILILGLALSSCTKDLPPNPYDNIDNQGNDTIIVEALDSTSIVGLHAFLFSQTCAYSGCHDGTFEPDFRTIESTYNTLVYQPVVKNDPQGSFTYRVLPFNPDKSVLITRLTVDIDGLSGIMPIAIDPFSEYPANKDRYIAFVRQWIANGAPDMFGNLPTLGNREPEMKGVLAFDNNNQLLERNPGNGSIKVPQGTPSITLWFAVSDDSTAPASLTYNKIKFSLFKDDFATASEENLQISANPVIEDDYFGEPANYYHKIVLQNPDQYGATGTIVYFRIYVKDPQHAVTEIPEDGSFTYIKKYFSFEITP